MITREPGAGRPEPRPGHPAPCRVIVGKEALRLGLVDRVVAPEALLDDAGAYAEELARYSSPYSMQTTEGQLHDAQNSTIAEAVREADRLMLGSLDNPDFSGRAPDAVPPRLRR